MYGEPVSLQINLFSTLLEDALIQLNFLDVCNHNLRIYKTFAKFDALRRAKYDVKPPKVNDELHYVDPKKLDCEEYKTHKLDTDRTTCINVLLDTYVELTLNNNFKPLAEFIQTVENRSAYNFFLEEDQTRNKITRHELSRKLRHQRNQTKSALYDTDTIIQNLVNQVRDSTVLKMSEARYIDNWEDARSQQNALRIRMNEAGTSRGIAAYHHKIEQELRVHSELERLIKMEHNDCMRRVIEVMAKYEEDIGAIDYKIEQMHSHYNDQSVKRRNLEQTFAHRQAKIENWLQFKKDCERDSQFRMRMEQAAIIVQAWWRGLMTRLNPGRFAQKNNVLKKLNKKK